MNEQIIIRQNSMEFIVENDLKKILQPIDKTIEFRKMNEKDILSDDRNKI